MMIPAPAAEPIAWPDSSRQFAFENWLLKLAQHRLNPLSLRLASADASFRRYFRIDGDNGVHYIVMDAPPRAEDMHAFVQMANQLERVGLCAPRVLASDIAHGFLLLTDLGSFTYLGALQDAATVGSPGKIDSLMRNAFATLVQWQQRIDARGLPLYSEALLRNELTLFPDWCLTREYRIEWTAAQQRQWRSICDVLVDNALEQPLVAVHRDFMPRNLMCCDTGPGILDFQDAVRGPITYDAASLLRDAFISWEETQEINWATDYWQQARSVGLPFADDFGEFWRQLEWTGLQRHLKVAGIFCRLKHRDGKPMYCEDLPRFFAYIRRVAARHPEFAALFDLLGKL